MSDIQEAADQVDQVEDNVALDGEDQGAPEPRQFSEVEQIAHDWGWRPEDEWKGDKTKWRSAAEYIRATDKASSAKRELKELKAQIAGIGAATAAMTNRALQQQAKELEQRMVEAVEAKDHRAVAQVNKDMRELEAEVQATRQTPDDPKAAEQQFARDNPWFGKNRGATALARQVSIDKANEGASFAEQLEAAADAVREEFPHLFEASGDGPAPSPAPRKGPAAVSSPSRGNRGPAPQTFAGMPPAVQNSAQTFIANAALKFGMTKEAAQAEFAKEYWAAQT